MKKYFHTLYEIHIVLQCCQTAQTAHLVHLEVYLMPKSFGYIAKITRSILYMKIAAKHWNFQFKQTVMCLWGVGEGCYSFNGYKTARQLTMRHEVLHQIDHSVLSMTFVLLIVAGQMFKILPVKQKMSTHIPVNR